MLRNSYKDIDSQLIKMYKPDNLILDAFNLLIFRLTNSIFNIQYLPNDNLHHYFKYYINKDGRFDINNLNLTDVEYLFDHLKEILSKMYKLDRVKYLVVFISKR